MASATTPIIFKSSVSMSQISQILAHPSIFTLKTSCPNLSIPKKPIKIHHFSCSVSKPLTPFLSLKRTKFSYLVPLIAQTSDWAQQGDELVAEAGEDEEGTKLYVGNLTYDVDNVGLAQLFDQGGNVEIAEVIYNRDTNQSRGFGFVTMSSVEEAEKAIDRFHGQRVNGRLLTVNKAAPRGSQAERPPRITETVFRLYVGNLPWDVDSTRLEEIFSEHGKVVEARLVIDRDTGRSRGFGFVAFSSETEMNDAITALDGETLNGRAIRVSVAEERPKRSFF